MGYADYRFLVVESDDSTAKQVSSMLRDSLKCEVHRATCGREAYNVCQDIKPDIIFVDTALNDTEGVDVLREIKQLNPASFVVMLSESGAEELVKKCITNGSLGYIVFPLTKEKILLNLRRFNWLVGKPNHNPKGFPDSWMESEVV